MNRKQVWLAAQIAVTLVLLFFIFTNFNWANFWTLVTTLPPWFYFYSFGLIFLGQLLYAFRWQLVLRVMGVRVPFRRVLEQYLIGIFFSNLLPTAIGGDAVKVYYLGQQEGFVNVGASVFMERFLGFFSLAALSTALMWWLNLSSPGFLAIRGLLTVIFLAFVASFAAAMFLPVEKWLTCAGRRYTRLLVWSERLQRFLHQVREVGRRPRLVLLLMAMVLGYCLIVAVDYASFFLLTVPPGVDFGALLSAVMAIAILTNVPITVNGLGLREQLHYLLFADLGVAKEVSVSLSLLVFSHLLILSLAGYWLWMRLKHAENVAVRVAENAD